MAASPRETGEDLSTLDGQTFLALRDDAQTIDVAAQGSGGWGVGVNMVAQGRAANVAQTRVSAGYFRVLGIAPFMGREFTADEDRPNGPAVAVLSHGLWTRVFGADPAIVGAPIMLRGEPYTVVGVMPAGFTGGVRDRPLDAAAAVADRRGRRHQLRARRPAARRRVARAGGRRSRPDRRADPGEAVQQGRARAVLADSAADRPDRRHPASAADAVGRRRASCC